MQVVRLKLKPEVMTGKAKIPVEVDSLTPDKIVGKNEEEIKAVKVWWGNKQEETGSLFDVSVAGESEADKAEEVKIIFEGDLSSVKRVGEGLKAGAIEVESDVGMHCGAMMAGGVIRVKGNADCWAGREMKEGELIIEGNAADYLCASYRGEIVGMTGGNVTVGGDVGKYAGQYMSGGEILIRGNAGLLAGLNMNGGRITIEGDVLMPGGEMTNGEIIVKGKVLEMMPSFKYDATEQIDIDGVKYNKYWGDFAMGEKKAKGVVYAK
jgi:formylmethanofuran dehydrogenase subunit C